MGNNTVQVKFGKREKGYNFSSYKKYPLDTVVIVQNTNGSKAKGIVTACYSDDTVYAGKVLHEWNKNKIKQIKNNAFKQKFILSKEAYNDYVEKVKNNKNTSLEQATKKINRNIALSLDKSYENNNGLYNVQYGHLKITLNLQNMTVLKIKNFAPVPKKWTKDIEMYNKLNEEFGIIPDSQIKKSVANPSAAIESETTVKVKEEKGIKALFKKLFR